MLDGGALTRAGDGFGMLLIKAFALAGAVAFALAIVYERRMQRHRRPGVSYGDVTLRRDGGWRRGDLFSDEGLALQRKAAGWGIIGGVCIAAAAVCSVIYLQMS